METNRKKTPLRPQTAHPERKTLPVKQPMTKKVRNGQKHEVVASAAETRATETRPAETTQLSPTLSDEKSFRLKNAHKNAMLQLDTCYAAMTALASLRLEYKLSNSRVVGVTRELGELRKVLSVYL